MESSARAIEQGRLRTVVSSAAEVLEDVAILAATMGRQEEAIECLRLFILQMNHELGRFHAPNDG